MSAAHQTPKTPTPALLPAVAALTLAFGLLSPPAPGQVTSGRFPAKSATSVPVSPAPISWVSGAGISACEPGELSLCLNRERFRVEVEWEDFQGGHGVGRAVPLTDDTGSFWFFDPDNLELMVKVLDGRTLNGSFWVFYGALSNVGYRVEVTNTASGLKRTYINPSGTFGSVGDTVAFPEGSGGVCGTIAGLGCPEGEICDFEPGQCQTSDVAGVCVPGFDACPQVSVPVCGCDGVTYSNDCFRLLARVQKDHDGACAP